MQEFIDLMDHSMLSQLSAQFLAVLVLDDYGLQYGVREKRGRGDIPGCSRRPFPATPRAPKCPRGCKALLSLFVPPFDTHVYSLTFM